MSKIITILLAVLLMVSVAQAEPLHNFYGEHPEVNDKATFIMLLKSSLKVPRDSYAGLYNSEFANRIGSARGFDNLVEMFASGEFEVRACVGPVEAYGFRAGGFETIRRGCYRGEWVLVHIRTGLQVASLFCANLFRPPVQLVSECMQIVVHLDGQSGQSGQSARLQLWGKNTVAGCGLVKVQCIECVPFNGQPPNATYQATLNRGVISIPRAMVKALDTLCVEFAGYETEDRIATQKAIRFQWAELARERAKNGGILVLSDIGWLGFAKLR